MTTQGFYVRGDKKIYGSVIDEFESERDRNEAAFQGVQDKFDNPTPTPPTPPTSVPILDNQAVPQLLFSYPIASYPFSFFMFTVERNGGRKIILTKVVTDGAVVSGGFDQNVAPSPDVTGVTITKAVVGANIEHYYTSTATGNAGTFKYKRLEGWA